MITWDILGWAVLVILSLYVSYLSYKMYLFNRLDKSWLFVTVGFLLIVLLRVLTILMSQGFFPEFFKLWYIYDPLLRIMNSACFIIGFWSMYRNFKNFEIVEKKVRRVVKKR